MKYQSDEEDEKKLNLEEGREWKQEQDKQFMYIGVGKLMTILIKWWYLGVIFSRTVKWGWGTFESFETYF